jgi:ribosomal protein L11 methyltransferase
MQFGPRLWVCPSTSPPPEPEAINLLLDPGLAFGTGTHPTTALCLSWLDEMVKSGQSVTDYGCGSGILAIAALKLGCQHALAIDNDPQALIATEDNAKRNDIALNRLSIKLDTEVSAPAQTDLLIANILANPLIELAPKLLKLVKPGGQIALSGILEEQADAVAKAYSDLGVNLNPMKKQENWCLLSGLYISP